MTQTYGLRVASALPLGLPSGPGGAGGPADVRVRFGTVETPPPAAVPPGEGCWRASDGQAWYYWSGVGAFRVTGGTDVVLAPDAAAEPDDLRLTVLGPLLATALHQRGLLVLHASAVAGPGGAVAIAAHSGTGKSTTAGSLLRRGYRLLTDDVLAVDLAAEPPAVRPGGSGVKLWPASAEALGHGPDALPTIGERYLKRVWDVDRGGPPVPLRALYVLERAEDPADAGPHHAVEADRAVSPLAPRAAVGEVMSRSYTSELLRLHDAARNLHQSADLVGRVPVIRLLRGSTFEAFEPWADRVAADVAARIGAPAAPGL